MNQAAPSPGSPDLAAVREMLGTRSGEDLALTVIYGGGGADCRVFSIPAELEAAVSWVGRTAAADRTISVGVASVSRKSRQRLDSARDAGVKARTRTGEHAGYAWLAADLDPAAGEDLDTLLTRARGFALPPTLTVCSGRGLHLWWRLERPVDVATGRTAIADLARALSGDAGAADEPRALRLAGTWNGKPDVQRLASIEQFSSGRRYSCEQLAVAACALAPRPAPPRPPPPRLPGAANAGNVAAQLQTDYPLAAELDRVCGPALRGPAWRCPTGHDATASLKLLSDNPGRWVCHGSGHPDGFGRPTKNGKFSGDVVDLFAYEAKITPDQLLAAERRRMHSPAAHRGTGAAGDDGVARDPVLRDSGPSGTLSKGHDADAAANGDQPAQPKPGRGASQAEQLLELAESRFVLGFSTTEGAFGVPRGGAQVAQLLRGGCYSPRQELSNLYSKTTGGKVASNGALADTLTSLEGPARNAGEPVVLGLRLAAVLDDSGEVRQVVLDLGDSTGRVVIADGHGWQVRDSSPIVFRRTELTMPLPVPVPGGDFEELRSLLNVSDGSWDILRASLVSWLLPTISHPIVLLTGEQGTGKTAAAALLTKLLDPSPAPTRAAPKDEEAWAVGAFGSYIVAVDNISSVPPWWSDALCRVVTGEGMVRRALYTNSGLSVLAMRRVVILTSIDPGAMRGDLSERLVPIELRRLEEYFTDRELDARFAAAHPRLLGALLDLLCKTIAAIPAARAAMTNHPRMADFAEVVAAVDIVTGGNASAHVANLGDQLAFDVVEGDPLSAAVLRFARAEVTADGYWKGPCHALLGQLSAPDPRPKTWPADATRLSGMLKRTAPPLRHVGLEVELSRGHEGRFVSLSWTPEAAADMAAKRVRDGGRE